MNTNKLATLSTLHQIEDNRQFNGYYKRLSIPFIQAGQEKQIFPLGARVRPSQYSSFNQAKGAGTVRGFSYENGYGRYDVTWDTPNPKISVEREKDLVADSQK